MAEDIWAQYRDSPKDKELPQEQEAKGDIWAAFREKQEKPYKPSYEEKEAKYRKDFEDAPNWWKKLNAGTNLVLNKAKSQLPGIPGDQTMQEAISPSLTKGIPVARHYVPQTPELTEFENTHPWISTGLNAAGTVGSMAPIAGGASMAAAARGGTGFMPQFGAQMAVNTPTNIADTAAKTGGFNKENIPNDLKWAAIQSALPAGITAGFGQGARHSMTDYWDAFRRMMQPGGNTLPSGAPRPFPTGPVHAPIPQSHIMASMTPDQRSAATTALMSLAGLKFGDIPGAITGGVIGHYGRPLIEPLQGAVARGMSHPSTQDIIRALMHSTRQKLEPTEAELAAASHP